MPDNNLVTQRDIVELSKFFKKNFEYFDDKLEIIDHNVRTVDSNLHHLHDKQETLRAELLELRESFEDFVRKDRMAKALQLAESRKGNLEQKLHIEYGYYAEIRRLATGILQGVDNGLISDDVLRYVTEEVMIKAPGYWLAPALVALASWIRNDKETHLKALNEALKRDDYKTTLFFMLVMLRLNRPEAAYKWLERFYMHQNPHALDREFIVILEATTQGVFPPAAKQLMQSYIQKWLEQFTESDEFINEQKEQWLAFFDAKGVYHDDTYKLLKKFALNWDELKTALEKARAHEEIYNHFEQILSAKSETKNFKEKLDAILNNLVTNFDDEELPLQKQVRLNELIIQNDGDEEAAQKQMAAEFKTFDEKINFLQLLTNASFNPELSGVDRQTQALAVAIGIPWIKDAYQTFVARCRQLIPENVKLGIDEVEYITQNGENEKELLKELTSHYNNLLNKRLSKVSFPILKILGLSAITILGLFIGNIFGWIIALIPIIFIVKTIMDHSKVKDNIRAEVKEQKENAEEVLRGCLAETVEYRRELNEEDQKAEKVTDLLESIIPQNFSKSENREIL